MKALKLILLVVVVSFVSSCSDESSTDDCGLIGRWCMMESVGIVSCDIAVEFTDDGKFSYLLIGAGASQNYRTESCETIFYGGDFGGAEVRIDILSISDEVLELSIGTFVKQ